MRALNLVAGLALAVALVGCSDDGGGEKAAAPKTETTSSDAPPTSDAPSPAGSDAPTPEKAVEAAYRTYVKAFLTGDGATAYTLVSDRCHEVLPLSEFASEVETAAKVYGEVDYTIESVDVNGDSAKVNATYPVKALNQGGGSEWALQDGQWRMDGC